MSKRANNDSHIIKSHNLFSDYFKKLFSANGVNAKRQSLKITYIYFIIGSLWILLSDKLAEFLTKERSIILVISIVKGWVYVLITSILIFFLVFSALKKVKDSEDKIKKMNDELEKKVLERTAQFEETTAELEETNTMLKEEIVERQKAEEKVISWTSDGKPLLMSGTHADITDRKKSDHELKESEEKYKTLVDISLDAIFINQGEVITFLNPAALKLFGAQRTDQIIGKSIFDIFHPDYHENIKQRIEGIIGNEHAVSLLEEKIIQLNGNVIDVEVAAIPFTIRDEQAVQVILHDITERKKKQEEIEFLSYHDQLTGLYNRRFYEEELKRLDTGRNLPMTIVMGDVNGLKLINDSFGHATGDELLKKVAEVLRKGCRADDIIARLGGDEFVILLPKTDVNETEHIIKRIKDIALEEKVGSLDISVSYGYETKNNENVKIQEILKKAEDHMYKKKLFESPSMRGKTISAIINTLHEKNKREEAHSHRVSALCESMGKAIGLPEAEIEELKTIGLLHDIGKIAIEENILNKLGKLTSDEWEEIKRHPEIGYRILSTVDDMYNMAEYVLYHHEKWDGNGYPKGLKKEEIPLQSRIITIADAYDAMTSEESYRSALSEEVAIKELQNNIGIQFDPELVCVFIEKVLGQISGL